jgi:hypothetical protein
MRRFAHAKLLAFQRLSNNSSATARGWLQPTDDYLRLFLARPELALVPESCEAERALHAALAASPSRPVAPAELLALQDADARDNYALVFALSRRLAGRRHAGGLLPGPVSARRHGPHRHTAALHRFDRRRPSCATCWTDSADAYEVRAAEMLFRSQRISTQDGQVLSGDLAVIDMFHETGGVGDFGRFLAEAGAPVRAIELQVLNDGNAAAYWQETEAGRHRFLLDLTHEVNNDLSHGLVLTMVRARSGLKALAGVLQKWVAHFLGIAVTIRPVQKVDDEAWRWHLGLDVEATALLNDLYEGREVEPARLQRLVSLFRLDFADPREMRADVAGKPVYLGLMMDAGGVLRFKPQNLLVNLPLPAAAS